MILPNILLATPTDGRPETASVTYEYHRSMLELTRMGAVTIPASLFFSDDLARARSRAVWGAFNHPTVSQVDWEYILWVDDDVKFNPAIVPLMLQRARESGHDVLAAPYPRKRIKTAYPFIPLPGTMSVGHMNAVNGCAEVDAVAFGFVLTSRRCLESMLTHYAVEWFTDVCEDGSHNEVIALLPQAVTTTRHVDGKPAR